MNIDLDIIDGARVEDTTNGLVVTRRHRVWGLDATQGHTSRLYQALSAPGVVGSGMPHPTIPGVICSSCVPESDGSPDGCWITETYTTQATQTASKIAQKPVIEVGSKIEMIDTDIDAKGNLITVDYTDPAGVKYTAHVQLKMAKGRAFARVTQRLGAINIQQAVLLPIQWVGYLTNGGNTLPAVKGPVNIGLWRVDSYILTTTDLGQTYTAVLELVCDDRGWQQAAAYLDPNTHQVPADAKIGNGLRDDIQVYTLLEGSPV